ncbi:MAG: DUF4332 domain-containing protein [Tannerella sp.]|jgi:predicted flap endonuclease-1-like 5' DNA nuclease|nr:DUF4332 domain-containing protein [Tannerella sp.]
MTDYKIETIEGIGPALGARLREAGVEKVSDLLAAAKTKKQRHELAAASEISEKLILKFANMADLFRIKGIGEEYSELLEAAGVDTVPELAMRNAANLTAKMEEVNAEKKLTRQTPFLKNVEKWIEEAKTLPRVLEY